MRTELSGVLACALSLIFATAVAGRRSRPRRRKIQ